MRRRIGVAGGGAWAKALSHVVTLAGHEALQWSRGQEPREKLSGAEAVIVAVPAQSVRAVMQAIKPALPERMAIISGAKGIELATGMFMHEVVADEMPQARAMALSGPGFAADVLSGLPTAVVLAAKSGSEASDWAKALTTPSFRIYSSDDIAGVEMGGALKNVLAIACGISDGHRLGDSARAALTTRGFAELGRFGRKLGARPETLMGLSGLGDLLLTCSSRQSRNYGFGVAIGEGKSVREALGQANGVVEGAHTVKVAYELARRYGVDMPIVDAVHAIVDEGAWPADVVSGLLARPVKRETDGE